MKLSFLLCLLLVAGCQRSPTVQKSANSSSTELAQSSPTTSSTNPQPQQRIAGSDPKEVKPKLDACTLLTSDEIKSGQGEPVKETKLSGGSEPGFNVSQCFFSLPTFANSVSLTVTQRGDGSDARDPKQFWKDTFHRPNGRREGRGRGEEGEKGEEKSPEKISGIGDEAFWAGGGIGGALYVLKGHSYVRVSIGGRMGDVRSRIKRSRALAQKVIGRL
ncbi:MAG TPA: hypothetical protein VJ180_13370 [Pyrinomonadaceae bacterium]|nr:hypothetical protein [Pyrinomonadaceae bacterium]